MSTFEPILIDFPDAIVGEKVQVKAWRRGDGRHLHEAVLESIEHVKPWLPWGPAHETPENSEAFVRKWAVKWDSREDMPAGIWTKDGDRLLGGCGLHRIDWKTRVFEIGYWIRASEVGNGYATEATRLLTALAFDTLGANRVFIRVVTENHKSTAIPRRLGFVEEGTNRNAILDPQGNPRNIIVFAMTPEDWRACS